MRAQTQERRKQGAAPVPKNAGTRRGANGSFDAIQNIANAYASKGMGHSADAKNSGTKRGNF